MKIYTKKGDLGKTSLFGGKRVYKHHERIEVYGTVDELNSYIGLIRAFDHATTETILSKIQQCLFVIGAQLATPSEVNHKKINKISIPEKSVKDLEGRIDEIDAVIPPLTHFILPGGNQLIAHCHIARCICRRAERLCSKLNEAEEIHPILLIYLNRLSDYLFMLARKFAFEGNIEEEKWTPNQ